VEKGKKVEDPTKTRSDARMMGMNDTFRSRIPSLSDAQLLEYLRDASKYKWEAVEAAVLELRKRGHEVPQERLDRIREGRQQWNTLKNGPVPDSQSGFLRDSKGPRLERIRWMTAGIVALGTCGAWLIYRAAVAAEAAAVKLEPEDSKSFLRQMEVIGGKENLIALEFRNWFSGLWHARSTALVVLLASLLLAVVFYVAATRE
jgi:hypothetical protein